MTDYAEKMAIEIHIDCVHKDPDDQYEILKATEILINQIIADVTRAHLEAIRPFGNFSSMNHGAYVEAIEKAEVKGEA